MSSNSPPTAGRCCWRNPLISRSWNISVCYYSLWLVGMEIFPSVMFFSTSVVDDPGTGCFVTSCKWYFGKFL